MVEKRPLAVKRPQASARISPPETVSLTTKEVIGILRRHFLLIILLTILGLIIGVSSWKFLEEFSPRYTARTYIQVLSPVPTDPLTIGATQLENNLLYNYRRSIAKLIKQQSMLQELVARNRVKDTDWFAQTDRSVRKAVRSLDNKFVAYAHRDSDFVEISMTCTKADEAALIVNEMLELFLAKQGATETAEVSERLIQLENQKTDVERELRLAEESLAKIREDSGITDLDPSAGRYFQHTITLKLNSLELEKDKLDLAIRQFQADISNLEELATGPVSEQVEFAIEQDPVMVSLAQQISLQEARLSGMLTRFGEDHRSVQQMRQLVEETKKARQLRKDEIAEQTRLANLENAKDGMIILRERFEELENLRQQAEAQKRELDLARVQYEQVQKIRDERLSMLDSIKEQIEKWKIIANDPETPKVQAVGLAPEPLEMVFSRQWWLWLPSGMMLGFLLGMGLAFVIEWANDLVRTPSDIAKYLRIPLLGIIPDSSEDNQVRGVELCHVVRKAPYSIISESYRRCRANLTLSASTESVKTLLVSSGMAGDGKTSTAVNLATAFVSTGKKVLLIDANFRRPNLNTLFQKVQTNNLPAGPFDFGLSSVLTRQCESGEAIRSSGVEGLDIIDCGPIPANPAELLGSSRMEGLLAEQRKKYDFIIIDGPPVLLVSDAKVIAGRADATILVFNAAATSRGAAQRAIRELKDVDAKIIGCILFAAKAIKGGYFQEQFSSYRKYQKAQMSPGKA